MTFKEQAARLKKPRPKLLDKRDVKAEVGKQDRFERQKCKVRSGGRCEVLTHSFSLSAPGIAPEMHFRRCSRRSSQNHHLIGGIGRRNKGKSILAAHRLDTCDRCHEEITNHVLVPMDGTQREHAATVKYERVR